MRVLFVLSQIHVTGAETYALSLASALREMGDEVILVSEILKDSKDFKFYTLPLHSGNHSYRGRLQNILKLRDILKKENIDLIHSHSRAANLVSHFGRFSFPKRKIPMVVTVHGRWRNHFAARVLPCLGDKTIAVCPYLERYLVEDLGIKKEIIEMIPNGIDTTRFFPVVSSRTNERNLVYIGRLLGQKGKAAGFLLEHIFPPIAKKFPGFSIWIAGGEALPVHRELADSINRGSGRETVKIIEQDINPVELYHHASIILGSGRVILEGMACGKPVVAIGESSAPGLVREENFKESFDSNFGDCGEWNLFENENRLAEDLEMVIDDKDLNEEVSKWGRKKIEDMFDSRGVAQQVKKIYKELI